MAHAKNCTSNGGLVYLGNTRDSSNSIWLSATSAGLFELDAAQGNQTIDNWEKENPGLHISRSFVVSNGNGGTHKLYGLEGGKPCLLDTQNQKRNFNWADFQRPDTLPGIIPPIGDLFPNFKPPIGGVVPPVGVVVPPVGGVVPPIGVVVPPVGGVVPPIGVVVPPVEGVVPPIGVVVPPVEGVVPPIGVVDPDIVPPIVDPGTGVIRLEGKNIASDGSGKRARIGAATAPRECIDPRVQSAAERARKMQIPLCSEDELREVAARLAIVNQRMNQVPLTEGRDFGQSKIWNFRVSGDITKVSDQRFGLDMDSNSGSVNFSLDRQITDDVVGGVTFSLVNGNTTGFNDAFQIDTEGFNVGPYVAVRLTPHWAVDGSLTYGRSENDMQIAFLKGHYVTESYAAEGSLHGQYRVENYFLRPKVTVSMSHIMNSDYDMKGKIGKLPINMAIPEDSFNYGYVEATTEVSRLFAGPSGKPLLAFVELGAKYEFERPNDGEMLTGDLTLATPSPWSGSLKTGVRMQMTRSLQFEAYGAYLSLGQDNLDIWQGSVKLSASF